MNTPHTKTQPVSNSSRSTRRMTYETAPDALTFAQASELFNIPQKSLRNAANRINGNRLAAFGGGEGRRVIKSDIPRWMKTEAGIS